MSDTNHRINKKNIETFFKERANKHDELNPLKTVIYQDKNQVLAKERDTYEKNKIKSLVNFSKNQVVLDIGCGIGRWADEISSEVKNYIGIDYIREFIDIANLKYKNKKNTNFFCVECTKLSNSDVISHSPYSVIMILGLFPYINNKEGYEILNEIKTIGSDFNQIIIREPVGVQKELVLNNVWSEDMETKYSAKYRTRTWFKKMFDKTLMNEGYKLIVDEPLFPEYLNNRLETRQHLFCLKKGSD
jgi:SAM-dependent methyltransferase